MALRTNRGSAGVLVLCLAFWAAAAAFGWWNLQEEEQRRQPEVIALPSVTVARVSALGFREVMADLYFIRAVQYFGNPWNSRSHYEYLYPLVDLVSELDPRFMEPLLWGGVAVQKNLGRETWINTAESTRLFRRGAERFPDDWRFHFFLGYNLASFAQDYQGAARALEKALGKPGAPAFLPGLITRLYSTAGDLDTAEALAEGVLVGSEDPQVRQQMAERLTDLETERRLRALDAAIEEYVTRQGQRPKDVNDLVRAGVLARLPDEPRGGTWFLDARDGLARSTAMHQRLRIHQVARPEADDRPRPKPIPEALRKPEGDEPPPEPWNLRY